jgi:hypothetical protein
MRYLLILLPFFLLSCQQENDELDVTEAREKLIGNWTCDEKSQYYKSTEATYDVTISKSSAAIDEILMSNFYQLGTSVNAKMKIDGYLIKVSPQTLDGGFKIKTGSGSIADDYREMTILYDIDDGSGQIDKVRATFTKK